MTLATADIFGPSFIPGRVGENRPIVYWDDFVTGYTVLKTGGPLDQNPGGTFTDISDSGEWFLSVSGSPSVYPSVAGEAGGILTMTTGTTGRINAQLNGEMFTLAADRGLYFETRLNVASTADFYMGIMDSDANLTNFSNGVGFGFEATATLSARTEKTSNSNTWANTATASTINSGEYNTFAFRCRSGKKVDFYLNGDKITTVDSEADYPDNATLSPAFMIQGNGVVTETLKIDYILCVNDR